MIALGKYNPHASSTLRWEWELIGTKENPYPNNYKAILKHMSGEEKFILPKLPENTFRFIITTYYHPREITYCIGEHVMIVSGKALP